MPKNPFIYYGLLVIVASAAVFLGAELTKRIEFAVPYALGVGVVLLVIGIYTEMRKKQGSKEENKKS